MTHTRSRFPAHAILLAVLMLLTCLTGTAAVPLHPQSEDGQAQSEQQRRLSYYYLAAQKQKDQGNISAMVDLLQHCLRIDSLNPAATYDLGTIWFPLRRDSSSLAQLQHAVELDPNNPWYLETLATAHLQMRQQDEAIPVLERMAKLQSKRTDIPAQLYQLYKQKGRSEDAIQALDRLQTLQGNSTRIAALKYQLYMDLNDTTQAFGVLHNLCREYPYDVQSLLYLANQYVNVGYSDSAQMVFHQVERIDPQNILLKYSRLQYHLAVGDTVHYRAMRDSLILSPSVDDDLRNEALTQMVSEVANDTTCIPHCDSIFARVLEADRPPVSALNMYVIYRTYVYQEQPVQIIPILQRIIEVDPSNLQTIQAMLQIYLQQNDAPAIRDLCQKALIYHPDNLSFHYFLGMALAQEKQTQAAIKALTTAIRQTDEESNPQMVGDIYCLLGDLLHENGQERQAFSAYDSCLVYMPDNAACLNNYAYFLSLKADQLEEAEQMSYRAIKTEPNNKTYLDTYAWVLFMRQDYTTARSYMNRVVDPSLSDSDILADEELSAVLIEHAGDIHAKLGETAQALRLWQLASQKEKPNATLRKKLKKKKYVN